MIKRTFVSVALSLMFGLAAIESAALAATVTTTFPVSMVVGATCSVQATGINFGSIAVTGPTSATGSITVNCLSDVAYSVALDKGTNAGTGSTGARAAGYTAPDGQVHLIPYELYKDPSHTQIWGDSGLGDTYPTGTPMTGTGLGAPQVRTVYGLASPNVSSPSPVAGTYTDTVVVTVNF